mgnify:CR=1 FL=1|tara:strand:- start:357 stop:701 length:345 start_codon:yes stop_codon:yes gene_type:complete
MNKNEKTLHMSEKKYNGWGNYATWRINLEILGDIEWQDVEVKDITVDYLKEIVDGVVFDQYRANNTITSNLVEDYANAFLSEVNYHEILEHILDDLDYENVEDTLYKSYRDGEI